MLRALELAREAAARDEVPVGAVLVGEGRIIGEGFNQPIAGHDPTAHAEMLALRAGALTVNNYRLPGTTLYVTLEPCPMCAGAMVNARLGRLVYGADDPKAGACRTLYSIPTDERLNHRVTVISGVLADQCAEILQAFFGQRRRS